MGRLSIGALLTLTAGLLVPASASADEQRLQRVTYTVTASQDASVGIYFRDVDPPSWADYSHNPYLFSPKVDASVGPRQPWTRQVMLADPQRWAMVSVSGGLSGTSPQLRCELAVDGVVVESTDGPNGALCSLRHW